MEIEIIDDFLDKEEFDNLCNSIINNYEFQWTFEHNIVSSKFKNNRVDSWKYFYFFHLFYHEIQLSKFYEILLPLFKKVGFKTCIRAKANLYPNSDILYEHEMHTDYSFSHVGGSLCLNSCDGYTKFEDGTKVDSIANRFYTFDASYKHCSTTTTNVPVRVNINLNFF